MTTWLLRLAPILLILLLLVTPAPDVARGAQKAVSTDLAWGIPSSEFAPTGHAISDVGAGWVRIEVHWNEAEPSSKGSYDANIIARYDRAIDTARAAGAKVLVFVNGSPRWASGSGVPMTKPQQPADYADFMRYVATRYAGKVSAWEVWNEENTARFWSTGPKASEYVSLLKAAYPAVKAVDPSALVVFGGVSQNDYTFVESAYAAGAKGFFDVMAVHPYPGPNPPEHVWYADGRIGQSAFTGFAEVRRSMLARGDDKPIWLTEFGWSTTTTAEWGVTQAQQADYLTRAYRLLESYPYVEIAYWYNLRNNFWDDDADTWETQLGLMRTDFTHKPSYDAFKSYRPGTAGTAPRAPVPPTSATSGRRATKTVISLRHNRLIAGHVAGADGGQVTIRLQRPDRHRRWKVLRARDVTLARRGTFRLKLGVRRARMLLVRALYKGSATAAPSRSRALRVSADPAPSALPDHACGRPYRCRRRAT